MPFPISPYFYDASLEIIFLIQNSMKYVFYHLFGILRGCYLFVVWDSACSVIRSMS